MRRSNIIATMKFLHLQVALASLLGIVYVYAAPNSNDSPAVATPSPTTICYQPPTSTDPSKWSSDAYIKKNMVMPTSVTSIFWMGRVPNSTDSVLLNAQDCARRMRGVTIGMVMCQNNFVGPPPPHEGDSPDAEKWNHYVSQVYAENTSGVAWTIAGNFTSTSDYLEDEFPALVKNPNVDAVLGINPYTCDPFCYWYCPRKSLSKVPQCKVRICFHRIILLSIDRFH